MNGITAYKYLEDRLRSGMIKGQMHVCLRDVGRLAGGYAATGALAAHEVAALGRYAESLSIDKKDGLAKWNEGVAFGRRQPVEFKADRKHRVRRVDRALDWDDEIGIPQEDYKIVDQDWLEVDELEEVGAWAPADELRQYLEALFNPDEHVAYVNEAWVKGEKLVPKNKGVWDRTAGQLISELERYGTVQEVIGDPSPAAAGAWIRFNPVDGHGCKDENITSFRHALVESDEIEIERQIALIRKLELPVTTLVHSGGKSVHATVRIDADTIEEFRKRVNFLYDVCEKNGLSIDPANRNPSRLSRMPGVMRGDVHQRLLGVKEGKKSWAEWEKHITDLNDDLPDFEPMSEEGLRPENLPDLAPELIEGVLREGHKMRLTGPSKAGKSFALIQLAIAIAEGREWLGWQCAPGKVLYVNLELDRASCKHRIANVYAAKGWRPINAHRVHTWNLRGKSMPMDKLAPRLIRRAREAGYKAVIIDPIYKVSTGDENSAEDMGIFCNQLDKLCNELGCAVIDCHHHSKGLQGQKRSGDRASGSGVFLRDPDALLDIVELNATEAKAVQTNRVIARAMAELLDVMKPDWRLIVQADDAEIPEKLRAGIVRELTQDQELELLACMTKALATTESLTAWRIEGTLREFASFKAKNLWFDYPTHKEDETGLLNDAVIDGEDPPWKPKEKASANDRKTERIAEFSNAVMALTHEGKPPTVDEVMEYLNFGRSTFYSRRKEAGFKVDNARVVRIEPGDSDQEEGAN